MCVKRLIPVPDVLCCYSSEFPTFLFPAFQLGMAEQRFLFPLFGALSQHGVGEQVLEILRGLSYAVAPLSPHSHPPCSVLFDSTEHEGWELIELTLMYTRQA